MSSHRGKFLTVLLVLAALNYVIMPFSLSNMEAIPRAYSEALPAWYPVYLVTGLLVGVATLVGLWQMRRWGAYLLAANTAMSFVFSTFVLPQPAGFGLPWTLMTLGLGATLWFWAIARKWESFA